MQTAKRRILILLFTLGLMFLPAIVLSQTSTTGTIEGSVVDTSGGAVPGVTVTVTSPNLIRPQSAVTSEEGTFRILNLPPGRYTVVIEAAKGFGRFEQKDVEVNLSRTSNVTATMQAAGVGATVDVTATAGATIDTSSATTGTNVSTDQFSNFPTQRTVQSLYTIAPTVTRSGLRDASGRERDPSVAGSSGPENNYILDGINTTDPAFGGAGANLPFEFIQEVEVKTGAYGAEYGRATGGIFNVITKSGSNEFHGDIFAYFSTKGLVREVKNFPFTGAAANGFSEADIGGDVGGPIIKDKLWFFGAFNPQQRKNYFLTQTLRQQVDNKVKTPFYAGKLTYSFNQNNTLTFSTFGDFTKVEGFLAIGEFANPLSNVSGFGDDSTAFTGTNETGGHNYAVRLNSSITPTWIAEISGGLHFQRANVIPTDDTQPQIRNNFAILQNDGTVAPVTQTGMLFTPDPSNPADQSANTTGLLDFVFAPGGGSLQRTFFNGSGFGLIGPEKRDRYEVAARFQNIAGKHTVKYGFEAFLNKYKIDQISSGPSRTFTPAVPGLTVDTPDNLSVQGYRVNDNTFSVCAVRGGSTVVCPAASAFARLDQLFTAGALPAAITSVQNDVVSQSEIVGSPFLVRLSTRVRDFQLHARVKTYVESFYLQDDFKIFPNFQINGGLRWDYQQAYGNGDATYIKLNNFVHNMQPRIGFIWDFTKTGRSKVFLNYARYVETPIPLDANVRAGGGDTQTDKNFNVSVLGAGPGAQVVPGIRSDLTIGAVNLGSSATPVDPGLRPQTVNEVTGGIEYEIKRDLAIGARGIYRSQGSVIEDGSFDDGDTYFLFNPGERRPGSTEELACEQPTGCFGRARRYYRAVEFTATKRFTTNYQFIASYVYSSLIGNYEGLFRNDNGQSDPNITSLFDLVSLLTNTYGRLPNDRPHQFKFNGSYRTPWKLMISGNFYAQSGVPFNALIPHPVYGNNEGFGLPRGTATVPFTGGNVIGGSNGVSSAVGNQRSPFTRNLDLGAYYPWEFKENMQLRFQVDWFNVFNDQRGIAMDQTLLLNSGITGVPPIANPFYGSGLIFQFPSSLRFGVKFQF